MRPCTYTSGPTRSIWAVSNSRASEICATPSPAVGTVAAQDPDLPPGTCKQTDYAGDGADITVARTVTRNGQQLALDGNTIKTKYEPWQAVYQYAPDVLDPQALVAQGQCH